MKFIIAILLLTVSLFARNAEYPACHLVSHYEYGLINTTIKNGKCIEINDYNDTLGIYQIKNGRVHGEVSRRVNGAEFTSLFKNGSRVNNKTKFLLSIPDEVIEYNLLYLDSTKSTYSSTDGIGILLAEFGFYRGKVIVEVLYALSDDNELYIATVNINSDSYKLYYKSYDFVNNRLVQIFDYYKCNVTNYKYGRIKSIRSMNFASLGCYVK